MFGRGLGKVACTAPLDAPLLCEDASTGSLLWCKLVWRAGRRVHVQGAQAALPVVAGALLANAGALMLLLRRTAEQGLAAALCMPVLSPADPATCCMNGSEPRSTGKGVRGRIDRGIDGLTVLAVIEDVRGPITQAWVVRSYYSEVR